MCVHTCVPVCQQKLCTRVLNSSLWCLTVHLLEQTVLTQFQGRYKLLMCCAFLSLNHNYGKNVCSMRWWFLAYVFISTGTLIFALLYLFVSLLVEDSLPFSAMMNSFYSPVLLSISILFFSQLFFYSLTISFIKTILHNQHNKMRHRLENILQEISVPCPLMGFFPIWTKHLEAKSFILPAHQLDADAPIYLSG